MRIFWRKLIWHAATRQLDMRTYEVRSGGGVRSGTFGVRNGVAITSEGKPTRTDGEN
jgi:hypothetical protein